MIPIYEKIVEKIRQLLNLGTPIKLISSWLGHETIELTQNIYTHIDRTITKNDINKLYNNLLYKF